MASGRCGESRHRIPGACTAQRNLRPSWRSTGFFRSLRGKFRGSLQRSERHRRAGGPEIQRRIPGSGRGNVAYGKFFDGRAGFLSKKWLPVFANYRRDGYDFDARWDDELATWRQKKIMDLFLEENADAERFSFEVKEKAGFGKGGEKNFEGTLTSLEMETYLVCSDFRQRKNKKGEAYGWHIAVLATPEHLFGRELVTSCYAEDPQDSLRKIVERVRELVPGAEEGSILKLVAAPEDRPHGGRNFPFPQNLFHAISKETPPDAWTKDQIAGLYVALGQLVPKQQRVLWEKYLDGKSNAQIGTELSRTAGTVSTYHRKAMVRLRDPLGLFPSRRPGRRSQRRTLPFASASKFGSMRPWRQQGLSRWETCLGRQRGTPAGIGTSRASVQRPGRI